MIATDSISKINNMLHGEAEEKFRNELKFEVTEAELKIIESRISNICVKDPHVYDSDIYEIRSIYFDDINNSYYYENENGLDPREKFRIRIYNGSDERISLELKKKEHLMTNKKSVTISKDECLLFMKDDADVDHLFGKSELLNKFLRIYKSNQLRGKVIVSYERTPYIYYPGNVRITFDRNISSTADISTFFEDRLLSRPVMERGRHILEVKYDEFLPNVLYSALSIRSLRQTAFSKYYYCRKFTI